MAKHLKYKLLCCGLYLFSTWTAIQSLYAEDSCTAENEKGICKPWRDCPHLVNEIRKFSFPVPEHIKRRLKAFLCGFENKRPILCCTSQINLSNESMEITPKSTSQCQFTVNSTVTEKGLPDVSKHRNIHLLPTRCGFADYDRIYNGRGTRMYEMPWLALLAYNSSNGVKLSCGGTIINENYVLTAAHCVSFLGNKLKLSHVVLGEYDLSTDPDCQDVGGSLECAPNSLKINIAQVTVHPEFSPENMENDIALLRLSEQIDLSREALRSICLPIKRNIQLEVLEGKLGEIAGWSITDAAQQTSNLLSERIPFLKQQECERAYMRFNITDRQICAGSVKGTSSCISDPGGPLMKISKSNLGYQQIQRGIVSFSQRSCGFGKTPGVYTNVAYYVDWILDNML